MVRKSDNLFLQKYLYVEEHPPELLEIKYKFDSQKKTDEAPSVKEKFDAIWARADVELTASVM